MRTFTAPTMAAALAVVRKELGPNAVILHTRAYKRGGILGLGAKPVVEVTATDGRTLAGRRSSTAAPRSRQAPQARPSAAASAGGLYRPSGSRPLGNSAAVSTQASAAVNEQTTGMLIRHAYEAARAEFEQKQATLPPPAAPAAPAPLVAAPVPLPAPLDPQLGDELAAVKKMVARLMHQQRSRVKHRDLPEPLFDQYLKLIEGEVSEELAEEVVQKLRQKLDAGRSLEDSAVRNAMLDELSSLLPTDEQVGQLQPTSDGRPRVVALIGPTGVGKTTTIAKLAANFKLRQKRRVSMITLDTYRIAAVDQLRTYANIIGVPLHVVTTPAEVSAALERCSDADVVLLDTAGRSQRDDARLDQLAGLLAAAKPHETHLVLASTSSPTVLFDAIDRFARLNPDHLIFTKLDEAVSFGVLLNVARRVDKKLSYVTTGQEVPHHIEVGQSRRLAEMVLDRAMARSEN